jgi:hypothetical protein
MFANLGHIAPRPKTQHHSLYKRTVARRHHMSTLVDELGSHQRNSMLCSSATHWDQLLRLPAEHGGVLLSKR